MHQMQQGKTYHNKGTPTEHVFNRPDSHLGNLINGLSAGDALKATALHVQLLNLRVGCLRALARSTTEVTLDNA